MVQNMCRGCHRGWYAVLCLHADWLLWTGVVKGLGVMLPTLRVQFAAETWMIGLLSGPLEAAFGTRAVAIVSGFLVGISMILASFSTSVIQMTFILSLLAGPGLSITNVLTRATMARYFTDDYATASGIGTSGHSVGMILFAPLAQLLLNTYGWRGALMLLGALALHLGVCCCLLRSPPPAAAEDSYQPIASSGGSEAPLDESDPDAEKKSLLRSLKDAIVSQWNLLGCSVCCQAKFWIAAVVWTCSFFNDGLWLIYFVSYAETKGFSDYEAVTFVTFGGIGNLVFKIGLGPVIDRGLLKIRAAMLVMMVPNSLALLVLPWTNSFWSMAVNSFVFNGLNGAISGLGDMYTREMLGTKKLVYVFSWIDLVSSAFHLSLGFFPGLIFDKTGSYDKAFVSMGCIAVLPVVALFAEWVIDRRNSS
ncbi:monocarboxylate transporter 13-like isoform X2 [Acanthaster planci]|uniref:Monocarboxylate transporter 13-like isoform X2 n=1 Tax=Acanthaster planci TaxID=133434 RepID=A0A8B7XNG8_ACAPL|nr:monocarboxylate transporter 13-like isoform X2 [Acanthaster planci]